MVRRLAYFFVQHSPLPFKVGAIFQLSVDVGEQYTALYISTTNVTQDLLGILIQKLVYGSPPPATVLEEDDIEQALALDRD